jgi:hypothetical protein
MYVFLQKKDTDAHRYTHTLTSMNTHIPYLYEHLWKIESNKLMI